MIDRRSLALAGLAAAAAGPAWAVDPRRRPKEEPPPPLPVPFRVSRGVPWTTVELDGGAPLPFGLNLVNPNWHCHPSVVDKDYKGGQTEQEQITLRKVRVGGRLLDENVSCFSSPLAFEGLPIAGYVGLRRYDPFLLDWDAGLLTVRAPPPKGWTVQRMVSTKGGPMIEATVDGRPARLILGAYRPWGLELRAGFVQRHKLWDHYPRRRDDRNADGAVLHQSAVVGELRLGDLAFDNLVTRLYRGDTAYRYDETEADGIIGYDLLRRMNLHLDRGPARSQAANFALAYSGQRGDPQADDRAGLVLKSYAGYLQIAWVDPDGAAFRAGLRAGDSIEGHDGEGGLDGLAYAVTRPAGTEVRVESLRGDRRTTNTIVLADRL